MNYYSFHIGDFRAGTVNMTRQARWIYRDMLDVYYDTERPLPLDFDRLCDDIGVVDEAERVVVQRLLRFKFIQTDDGYTHEVCEKVISNYRVKAETAKANGKRGGRPRNGEGNPEKPNGFPAGSDLDADRTQVASGSKTNQEPRTKNHKPEREPAARAARLPADFEIPDTWATWCRENRPDLNPVDTFAKFKDFWVAKAGKDGAKLDWFATWRNWCRGEKPGPMQAVAPANDPDSVANVQADGIAKGIGAWDQMKEDWYSYKRRVRGVPAKALSLGALESLAKQRQAA